MTAVLVVGMLRQRGARRDGHVKVLIDELPEPAQSGGMDDASRLVEPPAPTPEQLAEWQLVADRVDHGDDGDLIEWEKIAVELDLA